MDTGRNADAGRTAEFFAERCRFAGHNLDFSLKSLGHDVDALFASPLLLGPSSSHWENEAGLEAYIGETLRRLFDGEWKGIFSPSNPGSNYYLSWVQFGNFSYFPSHFVGRRIKNDRSDTGTFARHLDRLLPAIKLRSTGTGV